MDACIHIWMNISTRTHTRACARARTHTRARARTHTQVWLTNPGMTDPDALPPAAAAAGGGARVFNLGVSYRAAGGETLAALAARFLTTPAALLAVNPGLLVSAAGDAAAAAAAAAAPGQTLCVLPPLCGVTCPGGGTCAERPVPSSNPGFVQ